MDEFEIGPDSERKEDKAHQLSPKARVLKLQQTRDRFAHEAESGELHHASEDEEVANKELTHFQAHELAQQINLPAGQVTDAWRQFKRYDSSNRGELTPCEFQLLLRSVLKEHYPRVGDIPRELFARTHQRSSSISFTEFLIWLSEHAFSEALLLTSSHQSLRAKARELNASIPLVEDIKQLFDTYDTDSDGYLEFGEFDLLFAKLMGMQNSRQALPETRVRSFWMEIDGNRSGVVDFDGFLTWYLRYFDSSGDAATNPLTEYYESVRPGPKVDRVKLW